MFHVSHSSILLIILCILLGREKLPYILVSLDVCSPSDLFRLSFHLTISFYMHARRCVCVSVKIIVRSAPAKFSSSRLLSDALILKELFE